jgi:RsiW-degrading membrane proteinase PrsW (M82 family)
MIEQLKTIAGFMTGLVVIIVLLALVGAVIEGIPWISVKVYPWVTRVVSICMLVDLVLLPFAILKRVRGPISIVFVASSFVYGLMLWVYSSLVAYFIWGYTGLFLGLVFLGIGVVPVAFLAGLLNGQWHVLGEIILGVALTYGARLGGVLLASSSERA